MMCTYLALAVEQIVRLRDRMLEGPEYHACLTVFPAKRAVGGVTRVDV